MKNTFILIFINIFLALITEALLPNLLPKQFVPNLLLAFSLGILFLGMEDKAYISVFIGGLLLDLLSFGIVGETSLILTILIFLVILSRRYFSKSFLANLVTVVLITVIYQFFNSTNFRFEPFPLILNGFLTLLLSLFFSKVIKYFRRSNNWIKV